MNPPRTVTVVALVYRAALHLYPPEFRREFASEMMRDFLQATSEAWHDRQWRGLAGVWALLGGDLIRTLIVQWLSSGRAAVTLIPAAFSLAGMGAASACFATPAAMVPVAHPDRDQIALLLLATVVLLIVAATIILTLWFAGPLRGRTRR